MRELALAALILIWILEHGAEADVAVTTINFSHHFDECGATCTYNETHNGLFVNYNGILLGTYTNSYNEQSLGFGIEHHMGAWHNIDLSGSIIFATGYKRDSGSWGNLMLIPSVNVDWPIYRRLKWRTSYAVVAAFTGLKYEF